MSAENVDPSFIPNIREYTLSSSHINGYGFVTYICCKISRRSTYANFPWTFCLEGNLFI